MNRLTLTMVSRGASAERLRAARTTATNELVVPRSMPTARVGHAAFTLDSPGSAISKSATLRLRGAPLDFVEIARVVAQLGDELGDWGQVGLRAALESAELLRDQRERRIAPALDLAGEHLDRLRSAPDLGLEQLLAVFQCPLQELGRQLHPAPFAP